MSESLAIRDMFDQTLFLGARVGCVRGNRLTGPFQGIVVGFGARLGGPDRSGRKRPRPTPHARGQGEDCKLHGPERGPAPQRPATCISLTATSSQT